MILAAVAGLVVGFAIRVATPGLAGIRRKRPPLRPPGMEILTAAGFVMVHQEFGFGLYAGKWFLFVALLVAVTSADFLAKLIPDRISFPGAGIGLIYSAVAPDDICGFFDHAGILGVLGLSPGHGGGLVLALLGAVIGSVVLEVFRRVMGRIAGLEVMGMGDSKLLGMMGAFLGPQMVLFSLMPGLLCGLVIGVVYTRLAGSPHFPFGPALGLGGLLAVLYTPQLVDGVRSFMETVGSMSRGVVWVLNLALLGVAIWLILRVRRRAADYKKRIDDDYGDLEDED